MIRKVRLGLRNSPIGDPSENGRKYGCATIFP